MTDWSAWGYLAEPKPTNYLFHLLAWMLPILILQWVIAWKILWRNRTLVFWPAIAFGTYYTIVDFVAVHSGVWYFDPAQNLGIHFLGVLPLEEILFFYITALLVSQSFVMFLPDRLRK
ncbi:lycopene cyclase domain-containing protein [Kamptonema cortianum]|nr:lycopene cyclase domain-containing protein [Kamptonema cortianum]MDL5046201.1 lycopene cyclase domain-containing protein [Oscillatoria amoena NRMC-F 0135]